MWLLFSVIIYSLFCCWNFRKPVKILLNLLMTSALMTCVTPLSKNLLRKWTSFVFSLIHYFFKKYKCYFFIKTVSHNFRHTVVWACKKMDCNQFQMISWLRKHAIYWKKAFWVWVKVHLFRYLGNQTGGSVCNILRFTPHSKN